MDLHHGDTEDTEKGRRKSRLLFSLLFLRGLRVFVVSRSYFTLDWIASSQSGSCSTSCFMIAAVRSANRP